MIDSSNAPHSAGCSSTGSWLMRSISASTAGSDMYVKFPPPSEWSTGGNHEFPDGQSGHHPPALRLIGARGSVMTVKKSSSVGVGNGVALNPAASSVVTNTSLRATELG